MENKTLAQGVFDSEIEREKEREKEKRENEIIKGSVDMHWLILKEKEPSAISFEEFDVPTFEFKTTPANYTHVYINGVKVMRAEDAVSTEHLIKVLAQYLADQRMLQYYKWRNKNN